MGRKKGRWECFPFPLQEQSDSPSVPWPQHLWVQWQLGRAAWDPWGQRGGAGANEGVWAALSAQAHDDDGEAGPWGSHERVKMQNTWCEREGSSGESPRKSQSDFVPLSASSEIWMQTRDPFPNVSCWMGSCHPRTASTPSQSSCCKSSHTIDMLYLGCWWKHPRNFFFKLLGWNNCTIENSQK